MKYLLILVLSFFGASCSNLKTLSGILVKDTLDVAVAGGVGYLEGGKIGAVSNMTAAQIKNFKRMKTSAKNPRSVLP